MKIFLIFLVICIIGIVFCDDAVIESAELPDPSEIPTLSNGHIGFVIFGDAILMNGLYNGERGESHRARIPNYSNVLPNMPCDADDCAYQLNMREGFFQVTRTSGSRRIVEQIYAHRFYNRAIINKFQFLRVSGTTELTVSLALSPGDLSSEDLTQVGEDVIETIAGASVTVRCFETKVVEDSYYQPLPSKVCAAHTNPPPYLNLANGQSVVEYVHVTTVGITEEEVRKEIADVINDQADLMTKHTTAWERDWQKFEISVEGNENLNQILHASIFYLVSNLPSEDTNQAKDPFFGLSPGGIGKGVFQQSYQGHSFWDTEMWMHPPVLLLNPRWSEDLLSYRYRVRQAAADNAKNTSYEGYRFPWESGFTGREVTPDCCPEVVEYQHHIISDIAFAFRSHYAATHDVQWFKNVGCDIAYNTARFWESRVKYNESTKFYDIRNVMGPDEDHHDIDNNVYTNVNAALNLYFGDFAGCACKDVLMNTDTDYENFASIARSLKLLYDETEDFHPQFEGFNDSMTIKQADAVLLGFPLQLPMKPSTKRNNLIKYDKVTREDGPAMTWAMHTVGFLDLKDQEEAAKVFERSYNQYTREPFKVWTEAMPGVEGAGNFITGAGGFLQSVINGYGGVRLHFDSLTISNFYVPPASTSLDFTGITYLNNRFSLKISGDQATVTITEIDTTRRIKATLNPSGEVTDVITVGWTKTFTRDQELVFEAVMNPFETCAMKETVVGMLAIDPEPIVEETDWIVGANRLPDASEIPALSNGHIGFVVNGDAILMNGLYNGERGESHRARIPNYSNVIASDTCEQKGCEHRLNMQQGFFETTILSGRSHKVVQQIYAHRYYNRAIINRITLERLEGTMDLSVTLRLVQGEEPSKDITQVGETRFENVAQRDITVRCFETNVVEDPIYQPDKSKVCVAHTNFPVELKVPSASNVMEYIHVTAIGQTDLEVVKEIRDIFTREVDHAAILKRHTDAWENHWVKFGISVTGNLKLNQVIHASIFYLISNLPSEDTNQAKDPFFGLSPGGIGKGVFQQSYQGHSFWDTEMWMHPPVLLLNPRWSEDLLSYRYRVRQAAADNAKNTSYEGYRFPWESGFTGREVTPDCCPEVVEYQHHIIADIAFAFRSHYAATHDIQWFKNVGCDIAYNTARFWESRVKYNESTKFYDIRNVMGPDEDHHGIDNNVYTNVNAALNLYFGDFVGCACKDVLKISDSDFENFEKIARSLKLLYDETGDFHPQFEDFNDSMIIKQADVVLLGFPLQLPMKPSTKRNNLIKYDKVTREDGPAMTWAMHTVGFLDLKDQDEAAKVFERSYSQYTREPFKVWTEAMPGVEGAGNFITGAGGFLQSVINGYGGVRLHFDNLTITNFYVPPASTSLEFNGITYLNNRFSMKISSNEAVITWIELDSDDNPLTITIKPANTKTVPTVGSEYKISRSDELVIEASRRPFSDCEMKETVLGQKASGSALKISVILTIFFGILAINF